MNNDQDVRTERGITLPDVLPTTFVSHTINTAPNRTKLIVQLRRAEMDFAR